MGLGKTLTTLALIMSSLEGSPQISEQRPTLIVTPLSREYMSVIERRICAETKS